MKAQTSLPSLGAWIETQTLAWQAMWLVSLPSLGAWIETACRSAATPGAFVAPFTGSVD